MRRSPHVVQEGRTSAREIKISSTASSDNSLDSITLSGSRSLSPGESFTCSVAYTPVSNTTGTALTWQSSNTAAATVDAYGKVTAVAAGTATITATSASGKTDSIFVRVTKNSVGEVTAARLQRIYLRPQ